MEFFIGSRLSGSDRRPAVYKTAALPAELSRLAVLFGKTAIGGFLVVRPAGFEPATISLKGSRSTS